MSSHEESFDEVGGSRDFDISLFEISGTNFDLPDWVPKSSSTNNFSSARTEEAHYVSDSSDQVGIIWEPQLDQNILGSADFGLDPSWLRGNPNQLSPEVVSFLIAPTQADQVAFGYLDIDPSRPNSSPSTTLSNKVLTPSPRYNISRDRFHNRSLHAALYDI